MATPQELLDRLEVFGTRLGLDRVQELLRSLGEPQARLDVVLVAGTNGKGSTSAMLSSIGSAAGYRTGLYTSPHLESVRERIRVNGGAITEERLAAVLGRVLEAADGSATYFEALTAAALVEFVDRGVELAVLEVGLGGRLDATNVVDPMLSVITEIGLDHREHLGDTLAEIATEKAGILRAGVPALGAVSDREAREAIERRAEELGTTVEWVVGGAPEEGRPPLRLPGAHQLDNLALAVRVAERLARLGWKRIDRASIEAGVAGCRWPGRLEWVDLAAAGRVLLDGAHNPSAARALGRYLEEAVDDFTLVFGALADKEVERMLPALAKGAERVVFTTPRSPRAIPPEELAARMELQAEVVPEPLEAVKQALGWGRPVVVCGSLYLVGEVRARLREAFGVPPAAAELATFRPETASD